MSKKGIKYKIAKNTGVEKLGKYEIRRQKM